MSVRIDLDELQRRAASDLEGALRIEQTWPASIRTNPRPPWTHAVTLALVARIRELEKVADEALDGWNDHDTGGLCGRRVGQLREILEKGAVLADSPDLSQTDLIAQASGV